jgi:hypothetical protein
MPYGDCTAKSCRCRQGPDEPGCFSESTDPAQLAAMAGELSRRPKLVVQGNQGGVTK